MYHHIWRIVAALLGAAAGRVLDINYRLPLHPLVKLSDRIKYLWRQTRHQPARELFFVVFPAVSAILYLYEESGQIARQLLLTANLSFFYAVVIGDINKFGSQNKVDDDTTHPNNENAEMTAYSFFPLLLVLLAAMIVTGWWPVFGIGTFGGMLAELLELYIVRKKLPKFTVGYWIITGAMILAGGVLTTFYGIDNVSALLALQIGASTPLIIKRFKTDRR